MRRISLDRRGSEQVEQKSAGGNIVPQKQYEIMARPVIASNFPAGLAGYGFCMYHGERYSIGYVDGYKATLSYFPCHKITLIILENATYHNFNKDFRLHVSIRNTIRYWSRMRVITEEFFTRIKRSLLGKSATPKNNKTGGNRPPQNFPISF